MSRLGSRARPAVVRVQTQARAAEILDLCDERGWIVVIGVEPDKPEDVSDIEALMNPGRQLAAKPNVGRNDPCPCRSGKKFKRCCMALPSVARDEA